MSKIVPAISVSMTRSWYFSESVFGDTMYLNSKPVPHDWKDKTRDFLYHHKVLGTIVGIFWIPVGLTLWAWENRVLLLLMFVVRTGLWKPEPYEPIPYDPEDVENTLKDSGGDEV